MIIAGQTFCLCDVVWCFLIWWEFLEVEISLNVNAFLWCSVTWCPNGWQGWLHVLLWEFPTLAFHVSVTNPYGKVSPFLYHLDCPSSPFASGFLPTFFCPQFLPRSAATQSPLPSSFAAAPGAVLSHEVELLQGKSHIHNLRNKMASGMRATLFQGSLPMLTAVEIESSRPKQWNVQISKDPQSVAARHRRERISDCIHMLQRLVPGGTKMDTASMLDKAIHYVKFLKLQL